MALLLMPSGALNQHLTECMQAIDRNEFLLACLTDKGLMIWPVLSFAGVHLIHDSQVCSPPCCKTQPANGIHRRACGHQCLSQTG